MKAVSANLKWKWSEVVTPRQNLECQGLIIWISGPTASGKSSLAGLMATAGFKLVEEMIPSGVFGRFLKAPSQHCFALQNSIISSRAAQFHDISKAKHIAFDRSLSEDREVFFELHRRQGRLSESEYLSLRKKSLDLEASIPPPDTVVFLMPERSVLQKRLKDTQSPDLFIEELDAQIELYERWAEKIEIDLLRVDNSKASFNWLKNLKDL